METRMLTTEYGSVGMADFEEVILERNQEDLFAGKSNEN